MRRGCLWVLMLKLTKQDKMWHVYRTEIVYEYYFKNEIDALDFIITHPGYEVEPPVREDGELHED